MPMDMKAMMGGGMAPPEDDGGGMDMQACLDALEQVKAQIDDIAAQLVSAKPQPPGEVESPAEDKAPDEEAD